MTSGGAAWQRVVGVFAAVLLAGNVQAANWQMILSDAGRTMDLDRASIKKVEGDKVVAWARIVFDKAVPDIVSGGSYRVIEALNRYDCHTRSFTTLKRVYRKDGREVLREEDNKTPAELPVRTGTLDEKILKIACRPAGMPGIRQDFEKVVKEANEAAAEMRRANEAMLSKEAKKDARKEILKADLSAPKGVSAKPVAETRHGVAAKADKPPSAAVVAHRAAPRHRAPARTVEHVHWSYEGLGGPENWSHLGPENALCATGQRQSPIDIHDGIRVDLTPIQFRYRQSLFSLVDNGHTLQAAVADNRISLLGKDYQLVQFHFHRPAEERIGGRSFAMVAHLVHRADDGRLAVVAVLLEPGREHPLIQTLWNHLPLERNAPVAPPTVPIDLNQLLPDDRSYYTYMGSLTTPPCTEGVLWLVMRQPVGISDEQQAIFSRLYRANARPLQAANGRMIKESR